MSRLRKPASTRYASSRLETYMALTHTGRESSVRSGISLDSFGHSLDDSVQNRKGNCVIDVVVVGSPVQFGNHSLVFPEFHLVVLGTLDRTETLPQGDMVSTTRVEEHLATSRASPTVRATVIDALSNLYHHDLHAKITSRAIQQRMNTLSQVGISLHTSLIILSL